VAEQKRTEALRRRARQALGATPQTFLLGGFGAAILLGAVVLWLPVSAGDSPVSFLDAFFTAASAVCVTGLVVRDTGSGFSGFGQTVILVLIQAGGLGVMTFAALAFEALGRRMSLRAQDSVTGSLFAEGVRVGFKASVHRIIAVTLVVEALGALALFLGLRSPDRNLAAMWEAAFHAVSAFCNAGFSVFPDSLVSHRGNFPVMATISALIVVGGLGYPVLLELLDRLRIAGKSATVDERRLSLHSRTVLIVSVFLVVAGAVMLLAAGVREPGGASGVGGDIGNALFQSITARTAGFNSVDIGKLPLATLTVLIGLMFIGGSPGSCAGGVKTTTATLWFAELAAWLSGRKHARVLGMHIPGVITRRATMLLRLAVLWNVAGVFILSLTESNGGWGNLRDLVFEQISAFGTVGLSTGATSGLSAAGKLWIVATMYFGRIGPLSLVLRIFVQTSPGVRYPEGKVMIG